MKELLKDIENNKEQNNTSKQNNNTKNLYGVLGQILDGLWFMETEKRFGFDKAFEIDDAVWEIFAEKEAKRVLKFLGLQSPKPEDLPEIFKYGLFNQTIEYKFERIYKTEKKKYTQEDGQPESDDNKDLSAFKLVVSECKTYKSMEKIGRSPEQIRKICEGVGLTYYNNFFKEIFANMEVQCLSCPYHTNDSRLTEGMVCSWSFKFN